MTYDLKMRKAVVGYPRIGDMLRAHRAAHKISQKELARELGLRNHLLIDEVEAGTRFLPRKHLLRLSVILQIPTAELRAAWVDETKVSAYARIDEIG